MGKRTTKNLTTHHATVLIEACAYSWHLKQRFNFLMHLHLDMACVPPEGVQDFITSYFQLIGNLSDCGNKGPRRYIWTLENPPGGGLHMHSLIYMPDVGRLHSKLRKYVHRDWLRACGGTPVAGAVVLDDIPSSGARYSDLEYLTRGLGGSLRYMLKGLPEEFHIPMGLDHDKGWQGEVVGKRAGASISLSESRHRWTAKERASAFSRLGLPDPRTARGISLRQALAVKSGLESARLSRTRPDAGIVD